jgi:hypothetical protein
MPVIRVVMNVDLRPSAGENLEHLSRNAAVLNDAP